MNLSFKCVQKLFWSFTTTPEFILHDNVRLESLERHISIQAVSVLGFSRKYEEYNAMGFPTGRRASHKDPIRFFPSDADVENFAGYKRKWILLV